MQQGACRFVSFSELLAASDSLDADRRHFPIFIAKKVCDRMSYVHDISNMFLKGYPLEAKTAPKN